MRIIFLMFFGTLWGVNIIAQRYTTVKKFPLFPEPTLHTPVIHFPTEYDAYNHLPENSPWYLPLNNWKYFYVNDESNLAMYATSRYVDTLWKAVRPNMNINNVPANSSGSLLIRKVFPIPEDWYGLQVFLHLNYLTYPVTIWVNGLKIGNSTTASYGLEWNLTPYLVFGRLNTLMIQLGTPTPTSFSIGNAYIYAFPNVAIWDFSFKTTRTPKNKILLETGVLTKTFLSGIDETFSLELQLYNRRGQQVIPTTRKKVKPAASSWVVFQNLISDCHIWQADTPYWYTAIIVLKNKNNETVDAIKYRMGIRFIALSDSLITINNSSWSVDSINKTNIFTINTTFLANYPYRWLIFDLTPQKVGTNDLLTSIEKQVLTYRNYTPIVAWLISNYNSSQSNEIIDIIQHLDPTRPILWGK